MSVTGAAIASSRSMPELNARGSAPVKTTARTTSFESISCSAEMNAFAICIVNEFNRFGRFSLPLLDYTVSAELYDGIDGDNAGTDLENNERIDIYRFQGISATRWRNASCASSWCRASPICTAAAAAIGKIAVVNGMRRSEVLPLMRRAFGNEGRKADRVRQKALRIAKGELWVERRSAACRR